MIRPSVVAALRRILDDDAYRVAVAAWIDGHQVREADEVNWRGKRDVLGVPVMNICAGGPPVTVAVETIRVTLETGAMPESERRLAFPKADEAGQIAPQF